MMYIKIKSVFSRFLFVAILLLGIIGSILLLGDPPRVLNMLPNAKVVPYTEVIPKINNQLGLCVKEKEEFVKTYSSTNRVNPGRIFVNFHENTSFVEMKMIFESNNIITNNLFNEPERPYVWHVEYKPEIHDNNTGYELRRQIIKEIEIIDQTSYNIVKKITMEQPFNFGGSTNPRIFFNEHATEESANNLVSSIPDLHVIKKVRPLKSTLYMLHIPKGSETIWTCFLEQTNQFHDVQLDIPTSPPDTE